MSRALPRPAAPSRSHSRSHSRSPLPWRHAPSLLTLVAAGLLAAPLPAQDAAPPEARLRGFFLGLDPAVYAMLKSEYVTAGRVVGGSGLQLRFGWGFTEKLAVSMDVSVSTLSVADTAKYLLANGDLLIRYTPGTFVYARRRIAPFVAAGVNLRDIEADGRSPTNTGIYVLEGEVAAVQAGLDVYLTPTLSVTGAYYLGFGDFTDERIGNVTYHNRAKFGESHRITLGVTLHGGKR